MSKKITVAIAGLGSRGRMTYAVYALNHPEEMEIVAVADIVEEKVKEAKETFHLPEERCFRSAEEMLEQERLADVMFICTQDKQHVGHALPAIRKGYHILLEKPISPDLKECKKITEEAKKYQRYVAVCHVLRYTPFYTELKRILWSSEIGEVVSIQAIENVGYYHQAHSFVRGNWRKEEETSPMILAKCCHDMDMLVWLVGKSCKSVSSYGSLSYFNKEHAPEGATLRCLDGCKVKEKCPYDAEKIYITGKYGIRNGYTGWPNNVLDMHPTEESIKKALKEGPYGRCVFHCDNDVVDHQVVNLEFEEGITASFTMCAFTSECFRQIKIMGTLGDIQADMGKNEIVVCRFGEKERVIDVTKLADDFSGHGGGDFRLVHDFLEYIRSESTEGTALTSLDRSIESHYIALAAEESRIREGETIKIEDFIR